MDDDKEKFIEKASQEAQRVKNSFWKIFRDFEDEGGEKSEVTVELMRKVRDMVAFLLENPTFQDIQNEKKWDFLRSNSEWEEAILYQKINRLICLFDYFEGIVEDNPNLEFPSLNKLKKIAEEAKKLQELG